MKKIIDNMCLTINKLIYRINLTVDHDKQPQRKIMKMMM